MNAPASFRAGQLELGLTLEADVDLRLARRRALRLMDDGCREAARLLARRRRQIELAPIRAMARRLCTEGAFPMPAVLAEPVIYGTASRLHEGGQS